MFRREELLPLAHSQPEALVEIILVLQERLAQLEPWEQPAQWGRPALLEKLEQPVQLV